MCCFRRTIFISRCLFKGLWGPDPVGRQTTTVMKSKGLEGGPPQVAPWVHSHAGHMYTINFTMARYTAFRLKMIVIIIISRFASINLYLLLFCFGWNPLLGLWWWCLVGLPEPYCPKIYRGKWPRVGDPWIKYYRHRQRILGLYCMKVRCSYSNGSNVHEAGNASGTSLISEV